MRSTVFWLVAVALGFAAYTYADSVPGLRLVLAITVFLVLAYGFDTKMRLSSLEDQVAAKDDELADRDTQIEELATRLARLEEEVEAMTERISGSETT